MARALLVGCGCHGRGAARILAERDWAVRGTSRSSEGLEAIEAAGMEAVQADPDRVGSIVSALGDVTVVGWLLGGAEGGPEAAAALHRERLPSFLQKLVDTPVRGFVYEAAGTVSSEDLAAGEAAVADAAERWRIPVAVVRTPRSNPEAWAQEVAGAVASAVGLD